MTEIRIGDICVLCPNLTDLGRRLIGMECTVEDTISSALFKMTHVPHYVVRMSDGERGILCRNCLRKKQPPAALGSWDRIAEIADWRPACVPVRESEVEL